MQDRQQQQRTFRIIMGTMALALLAWAGWIAWAQEVTIHGKRSTTTYVGAEALGWAGLAACFGIALLGVMARNATVMACWMGFWLVAGIAVVLAPAYLA